MPFARRNAALCGVAVTLLCAIAACDGMSTSPTGEVNLVQTAQGTTDRLTPQAPLTWGTGSQSASTVTVDRSRAYQSILGFGGAFTEAASWNFFQLPVDQQQYILESYWGKDGIGYSMGRVHMNSCDFCFGSYNFDDVPGDMTLSHFDTNVTHDTKTMIPFIRKAMATSSRPIRIFATPWSPPPWMKVPVMGKQTMDGSAVPLGLIAADMAPWALYFVKFIKAYQAHGIDLWGVTVQNEPQFAAPWEACVYTPDYEREFIVSHLGPQLRKNFPDLKILAYDHNKNNMVEWATAMYSDAASEVYVDGIAFHWYSGDQFYNVNTTHWLDPSKILLPSEGCNCPGVIVGDWSRAEHYGHDMLGDLNNYAQGWTDWNLVLSQDGGPNHLNNTCDSPMIANHTSHTAFRQPAYYYIGQISKFVAPGSHRVGLDWDFAAPQDVPEAVNGDNVMMWRCDGSPRQKWTWPTDGSAGPLQVMQGSAQCADVTNFDTSNGANIQVWSCAGSNNQAWTYNPGSQTISTSLDGKCLDVENVVAADGANVQVWQCFGGPNQRWVLNETDHTVRSELSGKCLTAGPPFVQAAAFVTPEDETVVVVMNKANEAVDFQLADGASAVAASIPAHAIQTYTYSAGLDTDVDVHGNRLQVQA